MHLRPTLSKGMSEAPTLTGSPARCLNLMLALNLNLVLTLTLTLMATCQLCIRASLGTDV